MTAMADREFIRSIAREHLSRGDATGWFDRLYQHAAGDADALPWADREPNPHLIAWLDREKVRGDGKTALVVGCGLGDDAEALAARGFATTAFDISPTAIDWCRKRFPQSKVNYVAADALDPPSEWTGKFDFVFEAYTLQALPKPQRDVAIDRIARLLAPRGELLVVCRGRDASDPEGGIPWPLSLDDLNGFVAAGLTRIRFEDFMENAAKPPAAEAAGLAEPPTRRFRALFQR